MKDIIKSTIAVMFFVVAMILGKKLLVDDFNLLVTWWLTILLLGVALLPLSSKVFHGFRDKGYLFSKVLGIAITGYGLWFLSTIRILKFTKLSCYLVFGLILIITVIVMVVNKKRTNTIHILDCKPSTYSIILAEEVLFFIVLLIWTYIRAFKPEAHGTEKFMDYGFMNIIMRSEYMPPQDLWYAGETINYYYVGQYIATFLTKMSGLRVNEGYNLMMMTLAAFGFTLPFSIVYNLFHCYGEKIKKSVSKVAVIGGIIAGAAVSLASNMHFVLYYFIVPTVRTILELTGEFDKYWFPDSTRYIGYNPDTADKTIHEYPSYSYILGDLHAHVLNTIFVLTIVAILFSYMIRIKKLKLNDKTSIIEQLKLYILHPDIILIGFLIGFFQMTNYWDFPIYFVVSGAIILFTNIKYLTSASRIIVTTAIQGISILGINFIIALPFNLNFDTISTEIFLTNTRTPLYQLIILWGLPIWVVISFLIHLIKKTNESVAVEKESNFLIKLFRSNHINDLFIITLGLCAIGLVLMPEVIYVKDIYSGDYKRANTMFKLTYQAFILFGICFGYIITKFIFFSKYHFNKTIGFISLLLLLSTVWYSKVAVNAWYGDIKNENGYIGLDGTKYMEIKMYDDYLATNWLNENVNDIAVVLEANGDSYSDYQRVSVATGLPTVVGWHVHEWLWRGSEEEVTSREFDVQTIYTSTSKEEVQGLINKYQIEYIYVGKLENEKYNELNNSLLKELGEVVFESYIRDKTYIVKVNPNR